MKLKIVFGLITALLFNTITSGVLAQTLGVSHALMFSIQMGLSMIPLTPAGCLREGLNQEIWVPDIIEGFYPDTSFLTHSTDLSVWVNNNTLNLQEAGIDPKVYIDNEQYPIPVAVRSDVHHIIPLKRFDTENTVHINAIEIEESSGKRKSVTEGHRNSLHQKFASLAGFNWAPVKDGDFTPVIKTTGGSNKRGYKSFTFEDILEMETRFDELEIPVEGRRLVLNPLHRADLKAQDLTLYNKMFSDNKIWTFTVLRSSFNPKYNGVTGEKLPYNHAVSSVDAPSSLAYYTKAVSRAQGTVEMFSDLNNTEYRGDLIGFGMRGIAVPITGKYIGAVISPKA